MKKWLSAFLLLLAFNISPVLNGGEIKIVEDKEKPETIEKRVDYEARKPVEMKINGRKTLIYEFSPKKTAVDFIFAGPKQIMPFGYFIGKAKAKYGKKLEFVTTANFYDVKTKKLVGKIKDLDGKVCNENVTFRSGGIGYSNEKLCILKDSPKAYENFTAYSYGLPFLVRDGKLGTSRINVTNNKAVPRSALGVRKDGSCILVFANSTLPRFKEIMLDLKCEYALYLDSGNSRAFYASGEIYKRDNHNRKIKAVMSGFRNS